MFRKIISTQRSLSFVRKMSSIVSWKPQWSKTKGETISLFNSALYESKQQLEMLLNHEKQDRDHIIHVVMGNEAADADSIIGSLVYSYIQGHKKNPSKPTNTLYLPVLPIPRHELKLRCDIVTLFQELQIDPSVLVFVNEFPWQHEQFINPSDTETISLHLSLLDHNALNTKHIMKTCKLSSNNFAHIHVVAIVDHHMDLEKHPEASIRAIAFENGQALVGSNCTQIAERVLLSNTNIEYEADEKALLSTLLLSVIALDTSNFNPKAKKVTSRDIEASKELQINALAPTDDLYLWLSSAKSNPDHWKAFTLMDCLKCDYKEFEFQSLEYTKHFGASSILIDVNQFIDKTKDLEEFETTMETFCKENDLELLVVLSSFKGLDGKHVRQLLFYDRGNHDLLASVLSYLYENGSLGLKVLPVNSTSHRICAFNQTNTGASRKQVAPLVTEALTQYSKL